MATTPGPERTITVIGHGRVSAEPDIARLTFTVGGETRNTLAEARADTAERLSRCLAALAAKGIAGPDLKTRHFSAGAQTEWHKGRSRTVGYTVSNSLLVTVRDLAAVGDVIDVVMAAGASSLHGPTFEVEDPAALRIAAHTAAVLDARATADAVAATLGVTIKGVARATPEGRPGPSPFEPQPRMLAADAAMEAAPGTSIEAGTIEIWANLEVAYLIG
jgi:uncharacterized protein YggE